MGNLLIQMRLKFHLKMEVFKEEMEYLKQSDLEEKNYIILDEKGEQITSVGLANYLNKLSSSGIKDVSIFIGGAHGLPDKIKKNAIKSIALSKLILPHKFIRVILAEQLYRAKCIISNHPYHKE